MQRRNREITIFSLSAIDLFCSGMGAVMVVMVLLMPYYRKSAPPITPQSLDLTVTTPPAPVPVPVPKPMPPSPPGATIRVEDIDIAFVIDATGSMEEEIGAVKAGMDTMVKVLRRLSDDIKVGFVAYVDRQVPWTSPLLSLNRNRQGDSNLRQLQQVVKSVELVGNLDWPEHVYGGLQEAAGFSWPRSGGERRQMIVVIGDAQTHPEHVEASFALARQWTGASPNRSISVVYTGSTEDAATYEGADLTVPYFQKLAKIGKGQYTEDQGDLIGAILDLVIIR